MPQTNPGSKSKIKGAIFTVGCSLLAGIFLLSCSTLKESPKYELGDDHYRFRQKPKGYQDAWVYVSDDSITILSYEDPDVAIPVRRNEDLLFLKRSFDIDVMTVAFKFRPASLNLPRQLTTDFNGNVYLGYRFDRFRVRYTKTPYANKPSVGHRGITAGIFGGIGATAVTPWTTNNLQGDEYSAPILSRGLAVMLGIRDLTVGLGVGWDYLTDRDKNIWIYHNKPWYGLTAGLNLN